MTETTLAQKRINFLGLFIKQDNESANHELVMENIKAVLLRIQTKRKELIIKLEEKIEQQLSTNNAWIRIFNQIDNPNIETFYATNIECQILQKCAHELWLTTIKLVNEQGKLLIWEDNVTDNYKSLYRSIKSEIEVQTKEYKTSYLQEGENIYRANQT